MHSLFKLENLFKLFFFIQKKNKIKFYFVFFLMLTSMFIEILALSLILPIINILNDENFLINNQFIIENFNFLTNLETKEIILYSMLLLVIIFFLKTCLIIYQIFYQAKFVFRLLEEISLNLYKKYLYQPYSFHLVNNSAKLIRNILTESSHLVSGFIRTFLIFLTELLIILGVSVFLAIIEPVGFFLALIFLATIIYFINYFSKKKIFQWGEIRQFNEGRRLSSLQQGFGSIKHMILSNTHNSFIELFRNNTRNLMNVLFKLEVVNHSPKHLLEFMAVLGMTIVIISIMLFSNSSEKIIPIIGLFGLATFRLIPSLNRLVIAMQTMRYNIAPLKLVYEELINFEDNEHKMKNNESNFIFKDNLIFENVYFKYDTSNNFTLENLSFKIKAFETIGVIGRSGEGKSTLVDLITGMIKPNKGEIKIDDHKLNKIIKQWQGCIGYVPQDIFLMDDTIKKNISFALEDEIDHIKLNKAIEMSNLRETINSFELGLETVVGEKGVRLSGGQRQRIGIARALYNNPTFLVLDEATSSLDSETERGVIETIKKIKGTLTIIIITHRVNSLKDCDKIYEIKNKNITLYKYTE